MEPEKIEIQTVLELDDEFFEDIITCMFEGGSNYWIKYITINHPDGKKPSETPNSTWSADALNKGGTVIVFAHDAELGSVLTRAKLVSGIKGWMITHKGRASIINSSKSGELTLDAGDIDAAEADAILQYALFGKLIYG
jgi:hypothetical protein